MAYLVFAGILLVGTLVVLGVAVVSHNHSQENGLAKSFSYRWVLIPVALLVVVTAICSFTSVEARSVAIQTSFGRYDTTLDNGVHLTAPWADTEEFDTTIQTVDLADDNTQSGAKVQVAFKGGGQGWVNSTVRWSISEQGAYPLWQKYRTFAAVTTSLVQKTSRDAIINVANQYTSFEARGAQAELASKVKADIANQVSGYGVSIDSVSILSIPLDDKTQASLDAIVAAQNNVTKAQADQDRAKIDAATAKIREDSNSASPALNQRYCLEIVNGWDVTKNGPLPATFNCALGGTSAQVLVNTPSTTAPK